MENNKRKKAEKLEKFLEGVFDGQDKNLAMKAALFVQHVLLAGCFILALVFNRLFVESWRTSCPLWFGLTLIVLGVIYAITISTFNNSKTDLDVKKTCAFILVVLYVFLLSSIDKKVLFLVFIFLFFYGILLWGYSELKYRLGKTLLLLICLFIAWFIFTLNENNIKILNVSSILSVFILLILFSNQTHTCILLRDLYNSNTKNWKPGDKVEEAGFYLMNNKPILFGFFLGIDKFFDVFDVFADMFNDLASNNTNK